MKISNQIRNNKYLNMKISNQISNNKISNQISNNEIFKHENIQSNIHE